MSLLRKCADTDLDPVTLAVRWQQLVGLVDEAGQRLLRSAFSSTVREANDFGCVLFDSRGRLLIQSAFGHQMFAVCLPHTLAAALQEFPPETLRPGDVICTNDPWLATGHLNDISLVRPLFFRGRPIGYAGTVTHTTDIGGGTSPASMHQVFEEGLRIPLCKLATAGELNEDVLGFISANVRQPDETIGDLRAQLAALSSVEANAHGFLEAHDLEHLDGIADAIISRSDGAMRRQVRNLLPDGTYEHELFTDGFGSRLRIRVAVRVLGDEVFVDYAGTSPQIDMGVNSTLPYTFAYTVFALKCILEPSLPNNYGSYAPFHVTAPEGSFLNCTPPAPVRIRGRTGHYIPGAIFGALASAVPERVMADSGQPMWWLQSYHRAPDGKPASFNLFFNGGMGARPGKDGISAFAFPSPIATIPVEIVENSAPYLVLEKALRADSGGPGEFRGGCGQRIVLEALQDETLLALQNERVEQPALGRHGGLPGAPGVNLHNSEVVPGKTQLRLSRGDRVSLLLPGGGGFGDPKRRTHARLQADVRDGLVSDQAARETYGCALSVGENGSPGGSDA